MRQLRTQLNRTRQLHTQLLVAVSLMVVADMKAADTNQ
jgi:hypothetical protein